MFFACITDVQASGLWPVRDVVIAAFASDDRICRLDPQTHPGLNDPYLVVDESLETPPYRQIVERLRGAIERGDLPPNAPLPTVRQLAGDLGIAPNTVARAYAELQGDGWLVSDGRRGTRVVGALPRLDKSGRIRSLRADVERFVRSLTSRGFTLEEIAAEVERSLR
jgi:GntR family transcriptional regulator